MSEWIKNSRFRKIFPQNFHLQCFALLNITFETSRFYISRKNANRRNFPSALPAFSVQASLHFFYSLVLDSELSALSEIPSAATVNFENVVPSISFLISVQGTRTILLQEISSAQTSLAFSLPFALNERRILPNEPS